MTKDSGTEMGAPKNKSDGAMFCPLMTTLTSTGGQKIDGQLACLLAENPQLPTNLAMHEKETNLNYM
jgi:hypothetical protein